MNSFPCDDKGENYAYYSDFDSQSFVNIVERFKEFDRQVLIFIDIRYRKQHLMMLSNTVAKN